MNNYQNCNYIKPNSSIFKNNSKDKVNNYFFTDYNNGNNLNNLNNNYNNSFCKNKSNYFSDFEKKNLELQEYFYNTNRPIIEMDICEQIKFILKQFDFYLQLVLQNIFLTDDQDLKFRCYSILYNLYLQRMRVLNIYKLPQFDVYFNFCKV